MVKVADFGVARVQAQSGIMTAETGTYRWMAPEVWSMKVKHMLVQNRMLKFRLCRVNYSMRPPFKAQIASF